MLSEKLLKKVSKVDKNIVISYYAMYYMANAVLYNIGKEEKIKVSIGNDRRS